MTAHSDTKKAAARFGLAFEPAYSAYAFVARENGFLTGPGRSDYSLTGQPLSEALLAMFAAGTGLAPDLPAFLTTIRANGAAANLGNLLELAAVGEPEHLAESWLAIDREGNCRWTFSECVDATSVSIGWLDLGERPGIRVASIDGSALTEFLN